jgi:hypothetical protein
MTRLRIDWSVSIGTVLSLSTMLFAGGMAWNSIHSDVQALRERLAQVETLANANHTRLNGNDVVAGRLDEKFLQLERLMFEVRNELRAMNGRTAE